MGGNFGDRNFGNLRLRALTRHDFMECRLFARLLLSLPLRLAVASVGVAAVEAAAVGVAVVGVASMREVSAGSSGGKSPGSS